MRITNFLLLFTLFIAGVQAQDSTWDLARDKEGIKIYTRSHPQYKYKEYKGITTMRARPEEIIDILKDMSRYHEWAYNCVEHSATILKSDESRGEYYIYMEIKAPLVSNRDVISQYIFHPRAADGSYLVEFTGVPDFIPEKQGLVRVPDVYGTWKIIPQGNDRVQVIHQAFSHPGGSPPPMLVNGATVNAPFYMLERIREMVEQ